MDPCKATSSPAPAAPMVDVAINVLGKPYQTAVTLHSLLEHCGPWIDRIHVNLERGRPVAEHACWLAPLRDRVVVHRPRFALGVRPVHVRWPYRWAPYRHAVRYQKAWEATDKAWLFVTHNDVRYTADIIGAMLAQAAGRIAVGPVGQCWNCPAFSAGRCGPDRFMRYKPGLAEWHRLLADHPAPRKRHYPPVKGPSGPWPLPECRINEWSMLVNMAIARPATMPVGAAVPLGAFHGLDVGTAWFGAVLRAGHRVAHFGIDGYAEHAWASTHGNGHEALLSPEEYLCSEARAEALWRERYAASPGAANAGL